MELHPTLTVLESPLQYSSLSYQTMKDSGVPQSKPIQSVCLPDVGKQFNAQRVLLYMSYDDG